MEEAGFKSYPLEFEEILTTNRRSAADTVRLRERMRRAENERRTLMTWKRERTPSEAAWRAVRVSLGVPRGWGKGSDAAGGARAASLSLF